jgi:hypothetical protein
VVMWGDTPLVFECDGGSLEEGDGIKIRIDE